METKIELLRKLYMGYCICKYVKEELKKSIKESIYNIVNNLRKVTDVEVDNNYVERVVDEIANEIMYKIFARTRLFHETLRLIQNVTQY